MEYNKPLILVDYENSFDTIEVLAHWRIEVQKATKKIKIKSAVVRQTDLRKQKTQETLNHLKIEDDYVRQLSVLSSSSFILANLRTKTVTENIMSKSTK